MRDFFRDQVPLRLVIGGASIVFVWSLWAVRLTLGVGPMHDHQGNQAPVLHYVVGALTVTGIVALWIIVRGVWTRIQAAQRSGRMERSDRGGRY